LKKSSTRKITAIPKTDYSDGFVGDLSLTSLFLSLKS